MLQYVMVRPEPPGKFTATVVGLPELHAVADSEQDAISQARQMLITWLADGRVVPVHIPNGAGSDLDIFRDPNDPAEKEYLEELARMRREDLERTLKEYDEECSNSSSTPTT